MFTATNEIRIENSTVCNYACPFCPRERLTRCKEVMPTALYRRIVERAAAEMPWIRNTCLSGFGEFATDPDWREKLRVAAGAFERVHVVTNLSLLDDEDLDTLSALATDIRISLYATSDEVYREVHRPPAACSYQAMERRILRLLDSRTAGRRVILSYLEVPANRHQTEGWIGAWRGRADLLEVWTPHNWIDGRSYRALCGHRVATCGRPAGGPVQVQVDGTVNVCCFDFNGELVVGDLREQSFAEVFDGPRMRLVQELHAGGRADEIAACRVCDQRNCGECKSRAVVFNSRFAAADRVGKTSTVYENLSGAVGAKRE